MRMLSLLLFVLICAVPFTALAADCDIDAAISCANSDDSRAACIAAGNVGVGDDERKCGILQFLEHYAVNHLVFRGHRLACKGDPSNAKIRRRLVRFKARGQRHLASLWFKYAKAFNAGMNKQITAFKADKAGYCGDSE